MGALPGIGGIAVAQNGGPLAHSFLSRVSSTTNGTSYSFTSYSLGTAAVDRWIAVAIYNHVGANSSGLADNVPTSVKIGGVTATRLVGGPTGLGGVTVDACSIWLAFVPTGATGTIAVTYSITQNHCVMDGYRITGSFGISAAVNHNEAFGSPVATGAVSYADGSVVIAAACCGINVSFTWSSGVTERSDAVVESCGYTSASATKPTGGASSYTPTPSGSMTAGDCFVACVVALNP